MAEAAVPRATLRQRVLGEHPTAWWFVLPAVLIIVGLAVVPIVWSFVLSLHSADLIAPSEWIGLSNYDALLKDAALRDAIEHTVIYTGLFVPLSTGIGLLLALALNRRIRFIGIYRTLILAPFLAAIAAQGVLFSFIFDERFGVANAVLTEFGLPRQGFLGDPDQALFVLVAIGLWGGIGFPLMIYLAALQDVPRELMDAASVDGARRPGVLWHVVMPQLRPVTVFLVVWQTLLALQLFDLVYATTRGGPLDATVVVVYYVYNQAFELFNAGYAAAVAYAVAVALLLLVAAHQVYLRVRRA